MRDVIGVSQDVILEGLCRNIVSGFYYKTIPRYSSDNSELIVLELIVMTDKSVPFLNLTFRNSVLSTDKFSEHQVIQRALNLTSSHPLPLVRDIVKSLLETLTTFNKSVVVVNSNVPCDENTVRYPKFLISCSDSTVLGVVEISIPPLPTLAHTLQ